MKGLEGLSTRNSVSKLLWKVMSSSTAPILDAVSQQQQDFLGLSLSSFICMLLLLPNHTVKTVKQDVVSAE